MTPISGSLCQLVVELAIARRRDEGLDDRAGTIERRVASYGESIAGPLPEVPAIAVVPWLCG